MEEIFYQKKFNKKTILKKTFYMLMVIILLMETLMPIIARADARPDSIRVVTDDAEKEVLLGTTSEKARAENILGLAGKFSLFTKGNITLTGADAEGKIASGGTITATTPYPYEAGTEVEDETEAKIIAQNGINGSFDLTQTKHTTTTNNSYEPTKKIVAIGTNANMDWSNYPESQLVASDLIDFDDEFKYLQDQSNYLSGLKVNGKITKFFAWGNESQYDGRSRHMRKAVVFSGSDEKLNIFQMTVKEFNDMFNTFPSTVPALNGNQARLMTYNSIFFDIPKGSNVIINITGKGNVQLPKYKFDENKKEEKAKFANIFYLADEEELSKLQVRASNAGSYQPYDIYGDIVNYVFDGTEFLKDEKGNIKAFIKEDIYKTPKYSNKILYNMPQADSFSISGTMNGSILAPMASGSDNSYGYVHGTIACNSYSGGIQFGNKPNQIELDNTFDVKISKIDSLSGKNINGAIMEIIY